MNYLENELTPLRRQCERLFTATIAAQVLGWGPMGKWRDYTYSHSELCVKAQSAFLQREAEFLNTDIEQKIWFVDDFLVMLSQAHIITHFVSGFYDPRSFPIDLDIPALEAHLGIFEKPLALRVAEALTGGDPHPSYTPTLDSLNVIKRRHWNRFVRNEYLRILSITNFEQLQEVVAFLVPEMQKNHWRFGLYVLEDWRKLQNLLLT
jgi:hypothetical protein